MREKQYSSHSPTGSLHKQTREAKEISASLRGLLGVYEAARGEDVKQTDHSTAHTQDTGKNQGTVQGAYRSKECVVVAQRGYLYVPEEAMRALERR